MKQYFNAFFMCQSMFCAIPCPMKIWDENARDKQLLFLPFIGAEIGLLWFVMAKLCLFLNIPIFLTAFILAVYPFVISGYIHLDGFMDVTDAVKSYRNLEKRRDILKDSHVGAFAVIGCIILFIGQFAVFASMKLTNAAALVFIPIVSRCCSSLVLNTFKKISESQYVGVSKSKGQIVVLTAQLLLILVLSFIVCGKKAIAVLAVIAGYALALSKAYKSLEGVNGDVAGYALTTSEFCGVLVLALL
ncbi:MAG: adenosylcobinamide-GDP ribazoletransferase [Oscillospiraceae bacterium]|nr:adenosylcobinamide-GDP ribazoletransferase [Oscillospiraceae bacterium]